MLVDCGVEPLVALALSVIRHDALVGLDTKAPSEKHKKEQLSDGGEEEWRHLK